MKNISIFRIGLLVIIAVTAAVACQKQPLNPAPENLPGQQFQVTITENRDQAIFEWTIENGKTVNPAETIQQLCVTTLNTVTVRTTADVNIESSNPGVIMADKVNNRTYLLTYKSDGIATIKLYNGTGTGTISQTFSVKGIEYVDVEGVWFTYGGERLEIRHYTMSRPPLLCKFPEDEANDGKPRSGSTDFSLIPYAKPMIWKDGPGETAAERHNNGDFVTNPDQGALLTFEGLIPENTSFRTIESFESEWETHPARNFLKYMIRKGVVEEGEYNGLWPNIQNNPKDVSEYIGAKMWIAICNFNFYMASLKINAPKAKYFYLYHAIEDYDD